MSPAFSRYLVCALVYRPYTGKVNDAKTIISEWRIDELAKIDKNLVGSQRKAALYYLFLREAELIASIELKKSEVQQSVKQKLRWQFLSKVGVLNWLVYFVYKKKERKTTTKMHLGLI